MITDPYLVAILLIGGHFLGDFPLQGQYLSDAKNIKNPIPGIPWWWALFGHSSIHGMIVGLITLNPALVLLETVAHFSIDLKKCLGKISFVEDQLSHILCKMVIFWLWYIW